MTEENGSNPLRTNENEYGKDYKEHLLQQYKLYVEGADRVSSRRALSNTFFLSVNTALLSVDGLAASQAIKAITLPSFTFLAVFTIGSVLLSITWYLILRSYDQLNTGKFEVIHKLERALPASLYAAEWTALGRGSQPKTYRPISKLEADVPLLFIAIYLALLLLMTISYLQ